MCDPLGGIDLASDQGTYVTNTVQSGVYMILDRLQYVLLLNTYQIINDSLSLKSSLILGTLCIELSERADTI